ncbi:Clp protease N-terminal domain-containing protein [Streptomyces sp. NPDC088124]|uniref:Clp protease N-terminal domain-containing protein n=1 Tax=Streptomyces sp. NPDC088124 TaxID=3154654 RepID=UPI003412B6C2
MFERFTEGARDIVIGAVGHADRAGAATVTEEHLLLAMFEQEGTRASFAFAALGLAGRRASVEHALRDARRRGGLSKAETEALAGLGIDVDEVVARVEESHGEGALRVAVRRKRPRWSKHRPFTPGAKATLSRSLRIALGRGDRAIGDGHLLLALTARPGVVSEVLADHGATYATVERAVFGAAEGDGGAPGKIDSGETP